MDCLLSDLLSFSSGYVSLRFDFSRISLTTQTRASAAEIERRMVAEGHTVASLTGGVEGSQRDSIIDSFRSGEAKVLITTNVLARGIDVSTVSLVVNYVSLFISHLLMKTNSFLRISPRSTLPGSAHTPPTSKPTSTVSVVLVALAVLEWPFRLFQTVRNGRCSARFRTISSASLIASTPATGMK
jgi:hypothetical protein